MTCSSTWVLAAEVEEVHLVREEPSEQRGGHGEVDLRRLLGAALRGEHHRRAAGDGPLELVEEAGVLEVGALVARAGPGDVPQPAGDGEQVAALQDQLLGPRRLGKPGQVVVAEQLARRDGGQRLIAHVYPAYPASAAATLPTATCWYSWR